MDNILTDIGLSTDIGQISSSQTFPNSEGKQKTIIELIEDGADFEDKFPRPVHHFYDPVNDQPLQHPLLDVAGGTNASPDWALEDMGEINGQENSYKNAVDAFFNALTLPTEIEREQQWGILFESLGNVIHHIQDMAQPEHVRNDMHCGEFWGCGVPGAIIGIYDPSLFESRSKRVFRDGIPANLTNYTNVAFPTAREFWTTRASDPAVTDRKGLADFTNRNFVSKDTNFEIKNGGPAASRRYDLPVPSSTSVVDLTTLDSRGAQICQQLNQIGPIDLPPNSPCEVEFFQNDVTDSYDPTKSGINTRAASVSLFDQYLAEYNVNGVVVQDGDAYHLMDVSRLPTINQYNIEAAHEFLIPRAIAYGAGLIDHFFRKVVQLEEADQGLGWVIRNLTSDTLTGEFRVYYDDKTSFDRVAVPNAAWTFSIEPHGARTVKFSRPANESGGYMLVFRGGVGNEVDLVAGHYGILPKFTIYRVGDEVIQQFPTEWLRCAWRDSTLRTVDFTYEVRHTWKGQQYTRMANGIVGTALDERFDLDCEVEVPPDGGHGADPYYRNQSTYTDWIDIVPCPSGSNQVFCGTTVTNGVLKYEWFISTQNELTDLRVITPIDLGIDAAMQGVIDDIRATGF